MLPLGAEVPWLSWTRRHDVDRRWHRMHRLRAGWEDRHNQHRQEGELAFRLRWSEVGLLELSRKRFSSFQCID
jgi:hypothetical protein